MDGSEDADRRVTLNPYRAYEREQQRATWRRALELLAEALAPEESSDAS